ncbi:hypothetical protein DFH11DRAFT_1590816 [Phellopilus nigrolimitatus]|nr:hypothetical protein DFH11DRAFT_1590816 [Phellopilus nigrolimitatus]
MSNFQNTSDTVPSNYGNELGIQEMPGNDYAQQQPNTSHHTQDSDSDSFANASESERPLNVQPAREGGVAVDGRESLPKGKAGFVDKVIGKTEKAYGKYFNIPERHEKGELRESGGRTAEQGEARAPHD